MVFITEQLIRKKSEHNELIISTLEELSLHQEDIEKIEHIQNWCRDLKILLLQNNLISKIENLNKFKKLEYLNLAINNIEKIENLEKLESLEKLDLTLNFIGELTSIENLRNNYNLKNLILTGNPCTDFLEYREYTIAVLPQLTLLDMVEITRTEKLLSQKAFCKNRRAIVQREATYKISRDEQKIRIAKEREKLNEECKDLDEEAKNKRFWEEKSEHCPETRIEISKQQRKSKNLDTEIKKEKFHRKLFADCGRPYNINEPKIEFKFMDEIDFYELDISIYKFMDTSLLDVSINPNYCRVTIKSKIFQISLNDEIQVMESSTKRSMTTGHLLITMPKLNALKCNGVVILNRTENCVNTKKSIDSKDLKGTVDYKNIVAHDYDNSEIPPLI